MGVAAAGAGAGLFVWVVNKLVRTVDDQNRRSLDTYATALERNASSITDAVVTAVQQATMTVIHPTAPKTSPGIDGDLDSNYETEQVEQAPPWFQRSEDIEDPTEAFLPTPLSTDPSTRIGWVDSGDDLLEQIKAMPTGPGHPDFTGEMMTWNMADLEGGE
jgi:hypothetical protein